MKTFTEDSAGWNEIAGWYRIFNPIAKGRWYVIFNEGKFIGFFTAWRMDCFAVTDDFGNLVRVPA